MPRRPLLALAAIAAMAAAVAAMLPPPAAPAAAGFQQMWPVARGAYHVHSSRSDGAGTLDQVAEAARRAGLQFVVVTDHGDGRRAPDPPQYRAGVLCIDGVEISTESGHYVAIDLPATPYPLAGHPREVIDDVRRFGGFGFVAHPGSPKAGLQWTDWDASFDGLEWLNADSEWRDELWASLGRGLLTYAFRPAETLAALLDRPADVLARWHRVASRRRVPAIAGADAHARLGFRQGADPYPDGVSARLPSYEASFRAFTNHVILDRPLSGDAAADARVIVDGIREGRMFTSIDGFAALASFEARATSGAATARPGEYLDVTAPVAIEARIAAPPGTTLVVLRDGEILYEVAEPALRVDIGTEPGAYHLEARLPSDVSRSTIPWVLTNPMYVHLRSAHARLQTTSPPPATERLPIATALWRPEASDGSTSTLGPTTLDDGTPALEWQFTLAGGPRAQQYAALHFVVDAGLATRDRLQLRARSDRPRRLWAQLRADGGGDGERWGRTFYLDPAIQAHELFFSDFRPIGRVSSPRAPLDRVDSLLLVVDTLNNEPGASGRIWMTDLWLAR
jgi:hypothetical protein